MADVPTMVIEKSTFVNTLEVRGEIRPVKSVVLTAPSSGSDLQIESAVTRDELEHVIEEPDAGGNLVAPVPFQAETHDDLRFLGPAIDYRAAHRISSMAAMKRRV